MTDTKILIQEIVFSNSYQFSLFIVSLIVLSWFVCYGFYKMVRGRGLIGGVRGISVYDEEALLE